jgi:hypothetical protein
MSKKNLFDANPRKHHFTESQSHETFNFQKLSYRNENNGLNFNVKTNSCKMKRWEFRKKNFFKKKKKL